MGSPEQTRGSFKMAPNVSSTPKSLDPQPRYTSLDMSNRLYDTVGYSTTPQPLIRAIKEELLRLSQTVKGKTQVQDLRTTQDKDNPSITWSLMGLPTDSHIAMKDSKSQGDRGLGVTGA